MLLPRLLAAALLAALLAPAALAQDSGPGQGQGTFTLRPQQQLHPTPTGLSKGDALVFDWTVLDPPGAPLHFSQHIHIGAQQLNLTETTADHLQSRLVADRDGQYSILWENRGEDNVEFRYSYRTERAPANPTPLPWGLALLAGAGAALALARRR